MKVEWQSKGARKEETEQIEKNLNTPTNNLQAFYIHYFKLLATLMEEGKEMTPEVNGAAMAYYATIPVQKQ